MSDKTHIGFSQQFYYTSTHCQCRVIFIDRTFKSYFLLRVHQFELAFWSFFKREIRRNTDISTSLTSFPFYNNYTVSSLRAIKSSSSSIFQNSNTFNVLRYQVIQISLKYDSVHNPNRLHITIQ